MTRLLDGMNPVRWRPLAAATALAMLALVSLASGPARTQGGPAVDPASAQVLRVGLIEGGLPRLDGYVADPAVFNPIRLWRCCLARTLMAYPGLPTLDGGTVLHPDLAAAPPDVSDDGLEWTFRIRPGVRYQPPYEDRTVVAADIVRAIERSVRISANEADLCSCFDVIAGAEAFARGEASVIDGLRSADPMSITFRLTRPEGAFGHFLTDAATAPIPEGAADGHDPVAPEPDPSAQGPQSPIMPFGVRWVSSGPYMFETYPAEPADGAVAFVRNPSWDPATDPLRRPVVPRIEVLTAPSLEAALEMLDQSAIDILDQNLDQSVVARFQRDPALAGRLHQAAADTIAYVPMNLALPPFDDVAVRRAVNAVVDRAALMAAHLEGRAGLPWMSNLRQTAEVTGHVFADHLTAGLLVSYDPFPSPGGRGDVAAARVEMRASRYDTDGDGLCDAAACTGVRIAVAFPGVGEVLKAGLAAIGIQAEIGEVTPETDMGIPGNRTAMQLDWWLWAYGLEGNLDDLLRGGAALAGDEPTYNQSLVGAAPEQLAAWGYPVTEVSSVDDLLDSCEREQGHRRAACWAHLDQVVSEVIVPWIPIYQQEAAYLMSPRVVSTALDQAAFYNFPALERTVVGAPSP